MKKIISAAGLSLLAIGSVLAINTNDFSDVASSHENRDAIEFARDNQIVEGYEDGTFRPFNEINRAEFIKIVLEAVVDDSLITGSNCFPDVNEAWYAAYVCSAKNQGIIGGYPDGTFRPSQNISFAEAAKIISNTFEYPSTTNDVWYKPFVDNLSSKNAIPTTISDFSSLVTRGEMVEIIYRLKASINSKQSKSFDELSNPSTYGGTVSIKADVWADNWFQLYLDETLIKEDSVSINTERSFNAETFNFTASYPIHLNFIAKDYKENDTGLEYIGAGNQQMGDGGLIAQFTDTSTGEVIGFTDENVKCRIVHQAPLDERCEDESNPIAGTKPCDYVINPEPDGWKTENFQDSHWLAASVYSEAEVKPKDGYDEINWNSDAELIWGSDLEQDNTILCRMTIEGPEQTYSTSPSIEGCIRTVDNAELITCNDEAIVIESNGLPNHEVMVGIAEGAWNGQWPETQDYTGSNAFTLPGTPTLADTPTVVVSNAAGVTANGIPIFLPQSPGKAGEPECLDIDVDGGVYSSSDCIRDPVAAGEMDECGGHTGRGNDYHYHGTPTCLIEKMNAGEIIGYMLDGLPVYATLGQGSTPYDSCGGYTSENRGVHYVFTASYPYVTNCLLGEFNEGPRTEGSDVDTGGISDKTAGSITSYYVDGDSCAHMSFSGGQTITHCFDDHTISAPTKEEGGNTPNSGQKLYCGDGVCDNTESAAMCPADC